MLPSIFSCSFKTNDQPTLNTMSMNELSILGITMERLEEARSVVQKSALVAKTPLLKNVSRLFNLKNEYRVHFKLESLQITGSFKTRGLSNQLANLPPEVCQNKQQLVAMSAGNYGKAFAFAAKQLGHPATVCMPDCAPASRVKVIQSYNASVKRVPVCKLRQTVEECQNNGMYFLHSFDDVDLICGNASAGLEILEEVPQADVIIACCGGGGLLAGVAAAVKLFGKKTRVFGAEPEGAPKMFQSKQAGEAVTLESINTIASGLAPPMAGKHTFEVIKHYVEDIILVSDNEIKKAMKILYDGGLVVEPSGAAALAAFLSQKIPNLQKEAQIVVLITGSNVTPQELAEILNT